MATATFSYTKFKISMFLSWSLFKQFELRYFTYVTFKSESLTGSIAMYVVRMKTDIQTCIVMHECEPEMCAYIDFAMEDVK